MSTVTEEYLALVRAYPLEHIRDDAHLQSALAVFGPLFEKARRPPKTPIWAPWPTSLKRMRRPPWPSRRARGVLRRSP